MTGQCTQCRAACEAEARFCAQCGAAIVDQPGQDWVGLADMPSAAPSAASPLSPSPPSPPSRADALDAAMRQPHEGDPANGRPTPDASVLPAQGPERASKRPYWIMAGILAAATGASAWTLLPTVLAAPQLGAGDDPVAAAPDSRAWQVSYTDDFLSDPVDLVTRAPARQRDFPSAEDTEIQRTLAEGAAVSGRWVRGRDGQSRWLRLNDGGYIWEGNLTTSGGDGSPIAIPFSNAGLDFGSELGAYIDQASAQARAAWARADQLPPAERERYLSENETRSTYLRVPNRRWRGITVSGVAVHYEATSIYFREPPSVVRAAFRSNGLSMDSDGVVARPADDDENVQTCDIAAVRGTEDRAYGATALTCGV